MPRIGCVARARESAPLAEILARVLPRAERYLVKVTWHGYAQGTYTGPAALDLLLGALPGRVVLLEGHTSSRNVGGVEIDWEADAERHRTWVRQQDVEFLRRTGLAEVIARHGAQYLNVTEAWWDGACTPAEDVRAALGDVTLRHPELADFVPSALMELRGAPMISLARFKGPTRLGLSNLFGLIPRPLRTEWHGPDITYFASVCCDLARIYGGLFPLFGLVEGFDSAVRWDRKGLYRSRWGNYDLVLTDGLFTLSEGLIGADILASRLQGQDVSRSGFYDVVRRPARLVTGGSRRWPFLAISRRVWFDEIRHAAEFTNRASVGTGCHGGARPEPVLERLLPNLELARRWRIEPATRGGRPPRCFGVIHRSVGRSPWRVGRIDRSSREGPSRLNASLFACHHQFANGYRSQLLRCRRTEGAQDRASGWRGNRRRRGRAGLRPLNRPQKGRGDGSRRPCLHGQRRNQPQLLLGRPAGRLNCQAVQHRGGVPRERRAIGPRRQVAVLHGPLEPLP